MWLYRTIRFILAIKVNRFFFHFECLMHGRTFWTHFSSNFNRGTIKWDSSFLIKTMNRILIIFFSSLLIRNVTVLITEWRKQWILILDDRWFLIHRESCTIRPNWKVCAHLCVDVFLSIHWHEHLLHTNRITGKETHRQIMDYFSLILLTVNERHNNGMAEKQMNNGCKCEGEWGKKISTQKYERCKNSLNKSIEQHPNISTTRHTHRVFLRSLFFSLVRM